MSAYVDQALWAWRGKMWCHLIADSEDELHTFAAKLGLKRCWFQGKRKGHPHYDITDRKRMDAIALGAIPVTSQEIVGILRRQRTEMHEHPTRKPEAEEA